MANITLPKNAGAFASSRVLPDLTQAKPSYEELLALIAHMQAQAKAAPAIRNPVKTSAKGCVAFTAIRTQRGGVSLYPAEWLALAKALPDILEWIINDTQTTGTHSESLGGPKLPYTARPTYRDSDNKPAIIAGLADILAKFA